MGIDPDEAQIGVIAVEIAHSGFLYSRSNLVEGEKWSKGMGVNLRITDVVLLHLLPCVE